MNASILVSSEQSSLAGLATSAIEREVLAQRIIASIASLSVKLSVLEADIRALWTEFENLPKGDTILGCSTKKEFCEKKLHRTPRAIQYLLNGGNNSTYVPAAQQSELNSSAAESSINAKPAATRLSQPLSTDDWLTPPEIIHRLGTFDLDPCGCVGMPWSTAKNTYFLPEKNGLVEPWIGRVWCNPPYSDVRPWAEKMRAHGNGIMLLFANVETEIWRKLSKGDGFLFTAGEISFYKPDGSQGNNSQKPSVLIAYGADNVVALHNAGLAGQFIPHPVEYLTGKKVSQLRIDRGRKGGRVIRGRSAEPSGTPGQHDWRMHAGSAPGLEPD